MNGYERRTRKKRSAIIEAARELFFKHGVTETRITDIAEAAGVSPVTIYNYFGHKTGLLCAVLETYMTRAIDEAEQMLDSQIPFEEKVQQLFSMKQDSRLDFSQSFSSTIAWDDPEVQALYQHIATTRALPFIRRFIEQGQAAGVIHPDITWDAFMAYYSAMMSFLTRPDFLKSSDEYKQALNRLFFYGLVGK